MACELYCYGDCRKRTGDCESKVANWGFEKTAVGGGMPRLNARNIGAKCMRQAVKRKAIGPLKRQLKYAAGRE